MYFSNIKLKLFLLTVPMIAFGNDSFILNDSTCKYYILLSSVDGRQDLTTKIIDNAFLKKGYTVIKTEKIPNDIPKEGLLGGEIFSDIHSSFGARTSIGINRYKFNSTGKLENEAIYKYDKRIKSKFYNTKSSVELLLADVVKDLPECVKSPIDVSSVKKAGNAPEKMDESKISNSNRDAKAFQPEEEKHNSAISTSSAVPK